MKKLLYFLLILSFSASAQITVNKDDISAIFAPGNSSTVHTDTVTATVDIGQLGETSWDFSGLGSHLEFAIEALDPDDVVYSSGFPEANICIKSQTSLQGVWAETFSYNSINGIFNWHGNVSEAEFGGMFTIVSMTIEPVQPYMEFPFTYNSSIMGYEGTRTVVAEIGGVPVNTTIITVERDLVVDAFGEMTLPGGHVVDALRVKEDETTTIDGPVPITTRNINYMFFAKDGSQVNVPSDPDQPETGVISNSASISWNTNLITDIEQIMAMADEYTIDQNYPNPFSGATTIKFTIPKKSDVQLRIYDVLGNEVETLVNEEKNAGIYQVKFSGSKLANGLYIAKFTAGNYTRSFNMNLIR